MSFWKWSRTAGTNAAADLSINWAEGQAPSSVERFRARHDGGGREVPRRYLRRSPPAARPRRTRSRAIRCSTRSPIWTARSSHLRRIRPAAALPARKSPSAFTVLAPNPSASLRARRSPSGTLVQGTPYVVTYNNSGGAFYLRGLGSGNPYNLPLGGLLAYIGTTAPNPAFALPFGQAVSRATYATLFSLISTTFGSGDGSTTFNLPDLRGRLLGGKDDMGGSAASRITTAGSSIDGTTLGANGGAQKTSRWRLSALPNVSPAWTQSGTRPCPGCQMQRSTMRASRKGAAPAVRSIPLRRRPAPGIARHGFVHQRQRRADGRQQDAADHHRELHPRVI